MKLTEVLLSEYNKKQVINIMEKHFLDCSRKYFNNDYKKYEYPKFIIRTNKRYAAAYSFTNNTFICNSDFADNELAIKSNMYHETIHYYQLQYFGFNKFSFKLHGYHNDYFKEKMKEINQREGEQLVTITTTFELSNIKKAVKPIWVYMYLKGEKINWFWSAKFDTKLADKLFRMVDYYKADTGFYFSSDYINFKMAPRMNASSPYFKSAYIDRSDAMYEEMKSHIDKAKKTYAPSGAMA